MEKRFKDLPDTRIVMVGTSPYDETVQLKENTPFKTKNETIKRLVEYQKESAAKNNWEFTDLNAPMTAINQQYQQKDPTFTLCGSDRIHPDNDGHMVMAYLFLKAQGFVGKEVADMEINANKKQAVKSENCTVSNIKKNGKDLSFDYLAEALSLHSEATPDVAPCPNESGILLLRECPVWGSRSFHLYFYRS